MKAESVQAFLEEKTGRRVDIHFNQNRSTFLSVKRDSRHIKVSLHEMFTDAPKDVITALASYLCSFRRSALRVVRNFFTENADRIDLSHTVKKQALTTQGRFFDLQTLLERVNEEYFGGVLKLSITWFGESRASRAATLLFGKYVAPLRLVKIHRRLDQEGIPEFVIESVIYHEMLHAFCPPYVDSSGVQRIHSKEFRALEKRFYKYQEAKKWIQQNIKTLGMVHGWA